MVDFEFTQEQLMVRDLARSFAQKDVAPHAHAWDQESRYPAEAVRKMGELGLMGVAIPPEWDGAGFDTISYVLAMEEVSAACASTASSTRMGTLLATPSAIASEGRESTITSRPPCSITSRA